MLCDTCGKVTAEGSPLGLLLSDLLGSEMLLHLLLCPPVLPASPDPLSRQRSTTQKPSFLSALQREEIVSTAIHIWMQKTLSWQVKKNADSVPEVCKVSCPKNASPLGLSVVTELQTWHFWTAVFFVCLPLC